MNRARVSCRITAGAVLFASVALAPALPAAAVAPTTVHVASTKPWTATKVVLHTGDKVTIGAGGTMRLGVGKISSLTPAGIPWGPRCDAVMKHARDTWPAPGLACWSLIGRIGAKGKPFQVGTERTFTAETPGTLEMGPNDDYLGDNSGEWNAVVQVEPAGSVAADTAKSSSSSNTFLLIGALLAGGVLVVLLLLLLRRRSKKGPRVKKAKAPVLVLPEEALIGPTGAPLNPEDPNVYIFEVGFPDRSTLRVGYNFLPTMTQVRWRVTHDDATAGGTFDAEGGGSTQHFVDLPLHPALPDEMHTADVQFEWMIGSVPFAYSVRRTLNNA